MEDFAQRVRAFTQLLSESVERPEPALAEIFQQLNRVTDIDALDRAAEIAYRAAGEPLTVSRRAYLYVLTGALIEHGASAEPGFDELASRLAEGVEILAGAAGRLADLGVDLDNGTVDHADAPSEILEWGQAFRSYVVAAMARLARSPVLRQRALSMPALVGGIVTLQDEHPSNHGYFLYEVLSVFDGPLLLVDTTAQRMSLVRAEAIRNCAHMFALLEGADAMRLGSSPDATYAVKDHYATYGCLDLVEGHLGGPRLVDADWIFMLGVEVDLGSIPTVEVPGLGRVRVIVKAKKRIGSRSFDASDFFAPIHDACIGRIVEERRLSKDEFKKVSPVLVSAATSVRMKLGRSDGNAPMAEGLTQSEAWLDHWTPDD